MAYGENSAAGNVAAEYEAYRTTTSRKEFNGNAYAEWEPLKGLKLNVSYALRYYNQFSKAVQNPLKQWNFQSNTVAREMPDNGGDGITDSNYEGYKTLFQGRISYDREIAPGHHITAMFNAAEEFWSDRQLGAWRKDRLHSSLEELNAPRLHNKPTGVDPNQKAYVLLSVVLIMQCSTNICLNSTSVRMVLPVLPKGISGVSSPQEQSAGVFLKKHSLNLCESYQQCQIPCFLRYIG